VEDALFPLDSYACIPQYFQDQRYMLYVLLIDFKIDKNIIEIGENEYIEVGA
jgi:hypothetical protein